MTYYAIIVAGGSGSRMKSSIPKQFLLLSGKPVIMHTIEAFHSSRYKPEIIVVLHPETLGQWEELARAHQFNIPVTIIKGGANRFDSVKNGLEKVPKDSIVAVHDAVRPIISDALISRAFEEAREFGSAIPAIKTKDSIRQGTQESSIAVNREEFYLVQTPQTFRSELLKHAYETPFEESFTDDASVVEKSGGQIRMIEGNSKNIKITFSEDLQLAEFLLKR